jgi:hypothetical protein
MKKIKKEIRSALRTSEVLSWSKFKRNTSEPIQREVRGVRSNAQSFFRLNGDPSALQCTLFLKISTWRARHDSGAQCNIKKFWEELIAYFPLILHGSHRK